MIALGLFLGILLLLLYIFYTERKKCFNAFRKMGVNGPEPNMFWGNLGEANKLGVHEQWKQWRSQYGKICGYFEGPKPVLLISDVEVLKQIMISDFSRFSQRKTFAMQDGTDKFVDMFSARTKSWKRLRAISSPTFSTMRMKEMAPLLHDTISQLLECFESRCNEGKPFDIYSDYQKMTLTAIASCAFGIEVNPLKDPNDAFLQHTRAMFSFTEQKTKPPLLMRLAIPFAICFPGLFRLVWRYIKPHIKHPKHWFMDVAKKILEHRIEVKAERVDFLKLMLDAHEVDVKNVGDLTMTMDEQENGGNGETVSEKPPTDTTPRPRTSEKSMTMEEMQSQCMLFLLAGYETTSTALGLLSYCLALHPDVQQKLQAEIDQHFPDPDAIPDYTSVQNLPYLDMVIQEVLRMYPIGQIATTREAIEDCEIKGIKIPKGMSIQAHMDAIHHDPDLWGPEDPEEFVPERFLPERKAKRDAVAWMPFGTGPRNCIGMRFGLLEMKLTVVRLMRKYTIRRCEETKVPLPLNKLVIRAPAEGVHVLLLKRE